MPTIDDFVNNRWADAKEALIQRDPEYVRKVEDLVKEDESKSHLIVLSPEAIPTFEVKETPRKPLTTKWHKLLESCYEMTMQADIIRVIATSLTGSQIKHAPNEIAGRLFLYHFRSFPIHVKVLFERAHDVIRKSAEVYLSNRRSIEQLAVRYRQAINQETPDFLNEIRNSYVHARKQNWAGKVTAEHSWEPAVVIGQTPRIALEALLYPQLGSQFKSGKYAYFADAAEIILEGFGTILHNFEDDLIANYKLKYPMSSAQ